MVNVRKTLNGQLIGLASSRLAQGAAERAPQASARFVHEALERAIRGVGPLPPAHEAAEKQLDEQHGDVDKGVREVIENHVLLAGGQGLLTNLGGLVTATAAIPANLAGLALLQTRMIAGIAHLRGYDIDDPRVRNAVLATMLGEDKIRTLVRQQRLPAPPMAIATAPRHDERLSTVMAAEVASELITRVAGRRLATQFGRRIPLVGGAIGGSADAWSTYRVGQYAARELRARPATA